MEKSGYVMEEYFLELFCLAEEAHVEELRKKRVMGSGLKNVMEVPSGWPGRKWLCDIRTDGSDAGMRVAFMLREDRSIESQLEWVEGEDGSGLVIALNGTSGTTSVPQRVMEWLMTGQV